MSDTPRLTRKQLREMGKLEAKSADAPSLTDTEELRLRRPSRKELREAEKVRAAARAAAEVPEKLERKSVFMRFNSEAESENAKQPAEESVETPVITAEEPVIVQPAMPKREFGSEAETEMGSNASADSAAEALESELHTVAGEEDVPVAPQSLRDRLVMRTRRDNIRVEENVLGAADSVEAAEDAAAEVMEAGEAAEDAAAAAESDAPSEQDSQVAVKLEAEAETTAEKDDEADAKTQKKDESKHSKHRAWLALFILIVIGAIVGYLGGSLINMFFFSQGAEVADVQQLAALLL